MGFSAAFAGGRTEGLLWVPRRFAAAYRALPATPPARVAGRGTAARVTWRNSPQPHPKIRPPRVEARDVARRTNANGRMPGGGTVSAGAGRTTHGRQGTRWTSRTAAASATGRTREVSMSGRGESYGRTGRGHRCARTTSRAHHRCGRHSCGQSRRQNRRQRRGQRHRHSRRQSRRGRRHSHT